MWHFVFFCFRHVCSCSLKHFYVAALKSLSDNSNICSSLSSVFFHSSLDIPGFGMRSEFWLKPQYFGNYAVKLWILLKHVLADLLQHCCSRTEEWQHLITARREEKSRFLTWLPLTLKGERSSLVLLDRGRNSWQSWCFTSFLWHYSGGGREGNIFLLGRRWKFSVCTWSLTLPVPCLFFSHTNPLWGL